MRDIRMLELDTKKKNNMSMSSSSPPPLPSFHDQNGTSSSTVQRFLREIDQCIKHTHAWTTLLQSLAEFLEEQTEQMDRLRSQYDDLSTVKNHLQKECTRLQQEHEVLQKELADTKRSNHHKSSTRNEGSSYKGPWWRLSSSCSSSKVEEK